MYTDSVKKYGFTLVELMVVIAVLAILAGVVIISYGKWRTQAAQAAVENDLIAASTAMENYKNFNSGYPTTLSAISSNFTASQGVTVAPSGALSQTYYCLKGSSKTVTSVVYYVTTTNKTPHVGSC